MWKFVTVVGSPLLAALGQSGILPPLDLSDLWGVVIDPANVLYALAGLGVLAAMVLIWREREQMRIRYFDIPIRNAIDHLVQTVPHSFNQGGNAGHHAFHALYNEMRAGNLPVIGTKSEFNAPKRISTRKCKKLKPSPVLIPDNPASPYGERFDLIDDKLFRLEPLVEHNGPFGFTGLRVRSKDLYRMWPENS